MANHLTHQISTGRINSSRVLSTAPLPARIRARKKKNKIRGIFFSSDAPPLPPDSPIDPRPRRSVVRCPAFHSSSPGSPTWSKEGRRGVVGLLIAGPGGTSLTWENLTAVLPGSGSQATKKLLKGLYGYGVPSRVVAIMGPSGSGKSTLLDSLSGRLTRNVLQTRKVLLNGKKRRFDFGAVVKHIDIYTSTVEEFKSIITKYKCSSMMLAPIHGFSLWFEVEFNGPTESSQNISPNSNLVDIIQKKRCRGSDNTVLLFTALEDEPTHWHQTILHFPGPIEVKQDQVIEGSVNVSQSKEN